MAISKKELYLAIGTAMLSFVGAIAGVYLASRLDESNWEKRFTLEQKRVILEKRTSLIERTVILFNKTPTVVGLRGSLDGEKQLAMLAAVCAAQKNKVAKGCSPPPVVDFKRIEEAAKEIHVLSADFAATMSMDRIYFGPNTQKAVTELAKGDPWLASDDKKQALIDAMGQEINWFQSDH